MKLKIVIDKASCNHVEVANEDKRSHDNVVGEQYNHLAIEDENEDYTIVAH